MYYLYRSNATNQNLRIFSHKYIPSSSVHFPAHHPILTSSPDPYRAQLLRYRSWQTSQSARCLTPQVAGGVDWQTTPPERQQTHTHKKKNALLTLKW